jgi:hypothetical protein
MAFTDAERDSILGYLGYSVTPSNVKRVLDACAILISASPSSEARIRAYLTGLSTVESEISANRSSMSGAYTQLKSEARVLVNRISIALDLEVNDGVF